jgi:hypothetical protein
MDAALRWFSRNLRQIPVHIDNYRFVIRLSGSCRDLTHKMALMDRQMIHRRFTGHF